MKRPSVRDEEILNLAAGDLLEELQRRFPDEDFGGETALSSIAEAIAYEDDGYRICRNLDKDGWDCDSEIVDVMDNAGHYKVKHYRAAEERWVLENGVSPAYTVGTGVTFMRRGTAQQGVISKVNETNAEYTVFCADLGHVKEGVGTHGCIVKYEDCKPG